jgi:AcrR family transcriptional regulator
VRTPGSSADTTWPLIRQAGIELLYEYGYDNMNTRQLAAKAGLNSGSLYYYFSSKEEFLHRLIMELLQDILADLDGRLEGVDDAAARLKVYIETLVRWHVDKHQESYIARMEVRSLSSDRFEEYLGLRDRFDSTLDEILAAGYREGVFTRDPKHLLRIAILTMITGITGWYHSTGPSHRKELTKFYNDLVLRMVNVRPANST